MEDELTIVCNSCGITHMHHFGKILKSLREARGMSQPKLADKVGVTAKRVSDWEQEAAPAMRGWNYSKLAEALAMSTTALDEAWKGRPLEDRNLDPFSETPLVEIPMFDLPIAAGFMTEVPDSAELCDPRLLNATRFRVRIRGQSMEKEYMDGSIVEFKCLQYRHDGTADVMEVGKDYYVQVQDTATFKRMAEIRDDELIFVAVNKRKFPDKIRLLRENVTRMAKAVGIFIPKG